MEQQTLCIQNQIDVVKARQVVREIARGLGFGITDQTRIATAVSELTRNVIQYAEQGWCVVSVDHEEESTTNSKIQVTVKDYGPGIPDLEKAMEDGYSTGGSMGLGLPATRRLVDEFDISTRPGYTEINIALYLKK